MDALRAIQLLTDAAYLALGVAAVAAALRSHERARVDVAILFGTLAAIVALQELQLLDCLRPGSCPNLFIASQLTTILLLVMPYALLRLVDDVADLPRWQLWLPLVVLITLAVCSIASGPTPPGWLVLVLSVYVTAGTAYAALAFVRRALATRGITRRRMSAAAWGCALFAAAIVLGAISSSGPNAPILMPIVRIAGLVSVLCFWAGFFPPNWLSQTWRLPELLGYLRPTRLMAVPQGHAAVASDALALERLCTATAATTGAQRVFLLLNDPIRHDLYVWGAPSARIEPDTGLIGRVVSSGEPLVAPSVTPGQLPSAIVSAFASEPLPRTAILVPIKLDGQDLGILAAFAQKGTMFVEDDLEVVSFFAAEASAILRMQRYRQNVNELEALREADRLKDEFMAVVSHELRTPLTAISGYSDILVRKLSGPLSERQEQQVVGIRDAARRLLALINDLLDVSKLEAGTLDLHFAALDTMTVVERAATSLRVIAASKGVNVEVRKSDDELPPVCADDERLQQILSNLLMNAIKFTPAGGSIWIGASAEAGPHGPEIVFRVQDTGVGLSPDQVGRVWDRFYQAESSATRRFGGAGLGLSIVRRLVELHAGRVEATSAGLGQGSTFAVRLPAATGDQVLGGTVLLPPRPQPLGDVQDGHGPPPREPAAPLVLVVEDDPHIASVLRTYLEAEGYRVAIAEDGQQALEAARRMAPFVITLDISLPKLDGWSVLSALKREPQTAEIPVVIVSIVDNRQFGLVLGAADYLVKPIDHERLRNVLRGLHQARTRNDRMVLVVDDDPALRDVLSSLLSEDGWRVATAADGEAALHAIEHERPAAMVLDLMMPNVDGFEVLQKVREWPATRDVPVIVITAKELTEEDRRRLARSAERVVTKQAAAVDDLRQQIRELLASDSRSGRDRTQAGGRGEAEA